MKKRFSELARQILHGLWEEDPVEATFMGIHAYDGVLPRTDPGSRDAYHRQRAGFLKSLEEFQRRRSELEGEARLDLDVLVPGLEVSLFADQKFQLPERRADGYPSEALYGVYLLAMRRFAPIEERLLAVKDRLLDTPRLLAEGRENLLRGSNIPRIWTEIGIDVARGGAGFYEGLIPELAERAPSLKSDLLSAAEKAGAALEEYRHFLEEKLLPASGGDFAIGREAFEFLLRRRHLLPYDARQLQQFGEEMIASTQDRLTDAAARIDPSVSWRELVSRLKRNHPRPEELLEAYRLQMDAAKGFVEEHDLVTVPEGQQLHVVETPEFERATIPYAAYVAPAPFEERQDGFFWVTPVDSEDEQRRADQLRGHCTWGIPVTALHEGFPGHHLQLCRANRIASDVRRRFSTPVFVEGWALYCEEMMEEQGFLTDPRNALMRLKDQLWRACRVVIDAGLHCFGMGFDEAVEMLVEVAGLEEANAKTEVRRYTQTPTYQMSYLVGKREIQGLCESVMEAEGGSFSLKRFHDRLLDYGSIPVALVRKAMLES